MSEFHKVEKMSQVSLGSYKLVGSSAGWAGTGLQLGADLVKVTLAVAVLGARLQQTTIPHSGTEHYYIPTVHCPLSTVWCLTCYNYIDNDPTPEPAATSS